MCFKKAKLTQPRSMSMNAKMPIKDDMMVVLTKNGKKTVKR
jgi:hypothetical protein